MPSEQANANPVPEPRRRRGPAWLAASAARADERLRSFPGSSLGPAGRRLLAVEVKSHALPVATPPSVESLTPSSLDIVSGSEPSLKALQGSWKAGKHPDTRPLPFLGSVSPTES